MSGAAIAAALIASVVFRPAGTPHAFNFGSESGSVTWISFTLLASGALGAFRNAVLTRRTAAFGRVLFWCAMAVALTYLAVDELAQFHEAADVEGDSIYLTGHRLWGIFRGWNDLVVVAYGAVAFVGWWLFRNVLKEMPATYLLLLVGLGFYVVHTSIDSLVEPPTGVSMILEESCKVGCGYFLAIATWIGFSATPVDNQGDQRPKEVLAPPGA